MSRWISAWFALAVALLLGPTSAAAFWGLDGQCGEEPRVATSNDASVSTQAASDPEDGCSGVTDPTDPQYNACFELAEHPISALPEIITQNQAEELAAGIVARLRPVSDAEAPEVPADASLEDPQQPGQELVVQPVRRHRPTPSSCTFTPDDCERAPVIPNLNLEGSASGADGPELEVELHETVVLRDGGPTEGPLLQHAIGFRGRLDRPPQVL